MHTMSRWMTAGAAALALTACLENGVQPDRNGAGARMDQGFGMLRELGVADSADIPGVTFANELGLTADQKAAIRAAVDSLRLRMHHERGQGKPTFAEMKARRLEMRDSLWAAVLGALTPDQQALAQKIRDSILAGLRPTPMTLRRVARLTEKLALDSTEHGKLQTILEQQQGRRLSAFDSATSFEDFRARMDSLRADVGRQIAAILTPHQDSLFAALKARGDHEGRGFGRRDGHRRGGFWGRRDR